jgi:hypothetical protein
MRDRNFRLAGTHVRTIFRTREQLAPVIHVAGFEGAAKKLDELQGVFDPALLEILKVGGERQQPANYDKG